MNMKIKITIFYYMQGNGDGFATPILFTSEKERDKARAEDKYFTDDWGHQDLIVNEQDWKKA